MYDYLKKWMIKTLIWSGSAARIREIDPVERGFKKTGGFQNVDMKKSGENQLDGIYSK